MNAELGVKHYSNGNLFTTNPGIKIPLTLTFGLSVLRRSRIWLIWSSGYLVIDCSIGSINDLTIDNQMTR